MEESRILQGEEIVISRKIISANSAILDYFIKRIKHPNSSLLFHEDPHNDDVPSRVSHLSPNIFARNRSTTTVDP